MSGPSERLFCAWCANYFEWTATQASDMKPIYCSKACKRDAKREAQRLRDLMTPGRCPTPGKRPFDTDDAARRWLQAFPEKMSGNRPYLCTCGRHHLGRRTRNEARAGVSL